MAEVSVVIPTWQRHDLLIRRALPSVLSQRAELEVIVVSDGPDELARRLVRGLGDPRVRFLSIARPTYPPNPLDRWRAIGASAINRGIDEATGTWLLVMGDDDELAPGALVALLRDSAAADVVYGATSVRQRAGYWLFWQPPLGDFAAFPFGAAIIRRDRLGELRLDPLAWRHGEGADEDFWRRLWAASFTFLSIPSVVFRYWPTTAYEVPVVQEVLA